MRRACLLWVVAAIPVAVLGAVPCSVAGDLPYLASYASQVGFLPTSPSASSDALSGFVNPAAWRMLPGGEMEFYWSEPEEKFGLPQSWSLAIGGGSIGFGVTHWTWKREGLMVAQGTGYAGALTGEHSMTDYSLALSTGDRRSAAGIAYQWSTGESWNRRKDRALSFGAIWRPARYVSLGTAAAYTFKENEHRYVLDAGIRPLGSSFLTLFGDLVYMDDQDFEDSEWSAGLASELLPGVTLFGRTRKDDSYSLGISISLGTFGVSVHPDMNKDGDLVRTTYGARAGYRRPMLGGDALVRRNTYLSLDMKGSTRYRRYRWFDDDGHTLAELLRDLEEVRTDERYEGVVLNLSSMSMSWALAWELRQKLQEIRDAGKKVVTYFDFADMPTYYLASVADRVVIDPEGGVLLIGMGMSRTYMKKMLDKMGLGIQEWRFFKYKSAVESYAREGMSEADREQRQALMDGFYGEIRKDVSKSRRFGERDFDRFVNRDIVALADSAKALGLVDDLARWPDIADIIERMEGERKGLVGSPQMALFRAREDVWGRPPKVAVIYALGACAMDEGIAARRLGGVIRAARENRNIKAVVFRVDSPGGEIVASDIVADELKRTAREKPVIVSQGWVAGSGGYWISMYGDEILATPFTITGSIGVIGAWVWNEGLGEKLGLHAEGVTVGDHADAFLGIRLPLLGIMVPDRNLTPYEFGRVEQEIRTSYEHFLLKVAEGRGMTRDEVHKIGEGRVWTGRDGLRVGLVDEIGGLDQAVALAKRKAGIAEDQEIELVELPRMGLLNPKLLKMPSPIGVETESADLDYLKTVVRSRGRPLALVPPDLIFAP